MANTDFCPLQERPAKKDSITDSPHARVSKAIKKLINSSPFALTVGIEGVWGSGKSTIVNLLIQSLEKNNNKYNAEEPRTFTYIFDAWAHDTNDMRKVFLARLIDALQEELLKLKRLANENDSERSELEERIVNLEDKKQKILGYKKTVTTESRSAITAFGKWLAASALTIPAGAAFISSIELDDVSMPTWGLFLSGQPAWFAIIGILMSFSPFIVSIIWGILPKKYIRGTKCWKDRWSILSPSGMSTTDIDVTGEFEYTSIEFETLFTSLMKEYCIKNNKNSKSTNLFGRAVIVIDNLDRVNYEFAHKTWSSLQTYFQAHEFKSDSEHAWRNQIWFIIPYDKAALLNVWSENSNHLEFSSSFFDKCFQVTFESPPVISSAWINFFSDQLKLSLNEWLYNKAKTYEYHKTEQTNLEILLKTATRFFGQDNKTPEPRLLRSVINKIGILKLTWEDEFCPEALTLYALSRLSYTQSEIIKHITNDDFPKKYVPFSEPSKLQIELTGIIYGVKKERAQELMLRKVIHESIFSHKRDVSDKEPHQFTLLIQKYETVFWMVWDKFINEWLGQENIETNNLMQITDVIYDYIGNCEHNGLMYTIPLLPQFESKWVKCLHQVNFNSINIVPTLSTVLSSSEHHQSFSDELGAEIYHVFMSYFENDEMEFNENLIELYNFALDKNLVNQSIDLDEKQWLNWLHYINVQFLSDNKKVTHFIKPQKGVIESLLRKANLNTDTENVKTIKYLIDSKSIYPNNEDWQMVANALANFIHGIDLLNATPELYKLSILFLVNRNIDERKIVADAVRKNSCWEVERDTRSGFDNLLPFIGAICFENTLLYRSRNRKLYNFWQRSHTEELESLYIKLFLYFEIPENLWQLASDPNNKLAIHLLSSHLNPAMIKGWEDLILKKDLVQNISDLNEDYIHSLIRVLDRRANTRLPGLVNVLDETDINSKTLTKAFQIAQEKNPNPRISEIIKRMKG